MYSNLLEKLFQPASIAIVGASDKEGSNGHAMMSMARIDGYAGRVYPINPRLNEINGVKCFASLSTLPEQPDLVVIGVASKLVERIFDEALALGVRAFVIFAACQLEQDASPDLAARLTHKAKAAGAIICGPNCMGFYNPQAGLRIASFDSPAGLKKGPIAWIAQSGSALGALAHNDRRLGFSFCISTGMELTTGVADYMQWALRNPQTRVVGIFLEAVRDPIAFEQALADARAGQIPVVVLKVGRTEKSAQMALSHTGAIAGSDIAYDALFKKYGVLRVDDMDEMAATLALFSMPRQIAKGGLATIHDSGGERELVVDLAADLGLEYAPLEASTEQKLAKDLEPGLHAENPIDIFGSGNDLLNSYANLTANLVNDPNVALGLFMSNPRDDYGYAAKYTEALINAASRTNKPVAMVSNYALADDRKLAQTLADAGIPLLRGTRNALKAAQHLLAFRDFVFHPPTEATKDKQRKELQLEDRATHLGEQAGLELLSQYGVNVPRMIAVTNAADIVRAGAELTYPIVVKTAEDHAHKSDIGGVVLGLNSAKALQEAYANLADKLGPRALVMEMAPKGTELAMGGIIDPDFGPIVVLSAGGVFIEIFDDKAARMAPFGEGVAHEMLAELRISKLLDGPRGLPKADKQSIAHQLSAFSKFVFDYAVQLAEVDVNPLICGEDAVIAVDCLIVPKGAGPVDVGHAA